MKEPQPDRETERLRQLLERVVPTGHASSDRVESVMARGRQQRRRRGVAGAVGVAVAMTAVIVAPQLMTRPTTDRAANPSDGVSAQSDPKGLGKAADPFATTPCPGRPINLGVAEADDSTVTSIAPDAESIRLCPAMVAGNLPTPSWRPPADALQLTLSRSFWTDVEALKLADPHRCDAIRPAPDPYVFLVAYPGGRREYAAVTSICSDLTAAGRTVAASDVLDAFQEALGQQRLGLVPGQVPDAAAQVQCPQRAGSGTSPLVTLTRGPRPTEETTFARFGTCSRNGQADAEAVTQLNQEWPASVRDLATEDYLRVDRCPALDIDVASTYGVTTWGDMLSFEFRACGNYIVHGDGPAGVPGVSGLDAMQFLPSKELAKVLGLPFVS